MKLSLYNHIVDVKRVVLKVGTALLTRNGLTDRQKIRRVVTEIMRLRRAGLETILVSSGAVGAGFADLGLDGPPRTLPRKQAAAAVGQVKLMELYGRLFQKRRQPISQVLLTADDIKRRGSYLNVLSTINELLKQGILPIINENDTVATEELKFGDNDYLAALVTGMTGAGLLIVLSTIAGVYEDKNNPQTLLPVIARVTDRVKGYADGKGDTAATGGMETKLKAADYVSRSGEVMVIADGRRGDAVRELLRGRFAGTLFLPQRRQKAKKKWLAADLPDKLGVVIDAGAENALRNHKSLLAAGVCQVVGQFDKSEKINIYTERHRIMGKGIANDSSTGLQRHLDGVSPAEGHRQHIVIHCDNMVIG